MSAISISSKVLSCREKSITTKYILNYIITCEWKGMNDLQPQFSQSSTVNDDEDDEEDVYDLNAS